MTTRVMIVNNGAGAVQVRIRSQMEQPWRVISPGGFIEEYLHSSQDLVLTEERPEKPKQ